MRTASSIASSAVPMRVAMRVASAAVKLAVFASAMDWVAIVEMTLVCFSIALMIGLTRSLSASMSALSRSYAGLVLFGTPSPSEPSSDLLSL